MQKTSDIAQAPAPDQTLGSLIEHIQSVAEFQKAVLARELHDEMGGLLVGAVMDLAWAEQHVSAPPAELKQKLVRARQTLSAAIDLKRKLIEDLRPTLLDNVGLFSALRWHLQAICTRSNADLKLHLPEEERRFLPDVPIALFRIVQDMFSIIVTGRNVAAVDFTLTIDANSLAIHVVGRDPALPSAKSAETERHFLAVIEYRAAALHGRFVSNYLPPGSTTLDASFPLDRTLAHA